MKKHSKEDREKAAWVLHNLREACACDINIDRLLEGKRPLSDDELAEVSHD